MDALELALKCSSLLIRSMSTRSTSNMAEALTMAELGSGHQNPVASSSQSGEMHWNESDFEKHFKDHGKSIKFNYLHPTDNIR